ncbi:putative LRR receptor-like serine/threonine-protein kinase FLS2-like [Capsicum annuum]|nr:putative LRR receptor-like serine/threonine-protein kinase FLS2-like [Capsicum annuum]
MMYNDKSCHIRQRHNTVRELLYSGVITVYYVKSKDNVSDPLTKGLSREEVERTSKGIGLRPKTSQHDGIISPSLANLFFFREINHGNSSFHGGIPYGIGDLPHLQVIDVQNNQLKGSIPTSLFQHPRVEIISLAFNKLDGEMWKGTWNLPELRVLHLRNNSLTELKGLSLSVNNITGDIPKNIGCLAKLEMFFIGVGQVPPELGNLSNLRLLDLAQNYNLTREIPKAIFILSSLEIMRFSLNNLSRGIPATAGLHLQNLKELILRENQIKEEIPQYITNASMLEILSLEGNFLTGAIPTNLGNFHELRVLLLHSNQLTNEPREHELRFFNSLADSRMLRYVEMGNNPLNGVLPNYIWNLSSTIEDIYIRCAHQWPHCPRNRQHERSNRTKL